MQHPLLLKTCVVSAYSLRVTTVSVRLGYGAEDFFGCALQRVYPRTYQLLRSRNKQPTENRDFD
jgi:hypothetical protein